MTLAIGWLHDGGDTVGTWLHDAGDWHVVRTVQRGEKIADLIAEGKALAARARRANKILVTMAAIILGKTTCGICGRPLLTREDAVSFSPFVMNEADPLYFFSDRAFHTSCLAQHHRSAEAQQRFNELRMRTGPGNRKCVVCNAEIREPDDYLSFGYLAAAPSVVVDLNYLQFHRRHLPRWSGLGTALAALLDLERSGAWKGSGLRWLIEQLADAQTISAS